MANYNVKTETTTHIAGMSVSDGAGAVIDAVDLRGTKIRVGVNSSSYVDTNCVYIKTDAATVTFNAHTEVDNGVDEEVFATYQDNKMIAIFRDFPLYPTGVPSCYISFVKEFPSETASWDEYTIHTGYVIDTSITVDKGGEIVGGGE